MAISVNLTFKQRIRILKNKLPAVMNLIVSQYLDLCDKIGDDINEHDFIIPYNEIWWWKICLIHWTSILQTVHDAAKSSVGILK